MPQTSKKRRLPPAPSDFIPRNGFREYPKFAHERAREERDRGLGKPKSNSVTWHGETSTADTQWLVKGLLPLIGIALLSAQWGMLKTFCMLDLAAALITGENFANHRVVKQGGVLILAAEGASTLPKRLRGLGAAGKLPEEPQPLAWVSTFPPLLQAGAYVELEKMVVEIERKMLTKWGVPLVLIAIDTLVAAANFKDESDAAQGQMAMNVLGRLSKRFKCCVLGLDHFGKVIETGTRGTSAKEGAADAVLALLGERTLSGKVSRIGGAGGARRRSGDPPRRVLQERDRRQPHRGEDGRGEKEGLQSEPKRRIGQ
jgi:hypothetical protein